MVEAGSEINGFVGQPVSLTDASFTDKGIEDTHTAVWSWGDGTDDVTIAVDSTTKNVAASHVYDAIGTFVASLTVTDDDGGVGTDTTQILIAGNVIGPTTTTAPPKVKKYKPFNSKWGWNRRKRHFMKKNNLFIRSKLKPGSKKRMSKSSKSKTSKMHSKGKSSKSSSRSRKLRGTVNVNT